MRFSTLKKFSHVLNGLLVLTLANSLDAAEFAWHDTPGKYIELRYGDRPVLRYMDRAFDDSSAQNRYETTKVFHHLFDPTGKQLLTNGPTGEQPYSKDVLWPHHRGLFYGFMKITYGDGKKTDSWHCPKGQQSQRHVKVLSSEVNDQFGRHRVAINWHDTDGTVYVKEERELAAYSRPGGTLIDFVSKLESATGGVVHLDGDPQHAGFQFRASDLVDKKTKDQTYYLRPSFDGHAGGKGQLGETRNWNPQNKKAPGNAECTNRPWNAMSFVLGGQRYTALYLDHPGNPKPARYSERDYGRFGSYFVHDLSPEKPLVVRYRMWVQEGEMTTGECEALLQQWLSEASPDSAALSLVQYEAPNSPPPGYVALFNGKDLTGWKGLVGSPITRAKMSSEELASAQAAADENMRAHWSVQDGMIVYDASKKGANICTAKDYANFEMLLDWKIEPGGDSGIYLRGSPQVQIWDPTAERLKKHGAEKGSGALWNNKKHERFPLVKADRPTGEWNQFYIKMVGERLTVKLNGKLVTDDVVMENLWDRDQPTFPSGSIELQKHDGQLWFRNLFLRSLP